MMVPSRLEGAKTIFFQRRGGHGSVLKTKERSQLKKNLNDYMAARWK